MLFFILSYAITLILGFVVRYGIMDYYKYSPTTFSMICILLYPIVFIMLGWLFAKKFPNKTTKKSERLSSVFLSILSASVISAVIYVLIEVKKDKIYSTYDFEDYFWIAFMQLFLGVTLILLTFAGYEFQKSHTAK